MKYNSVISRLLLGVSGALMAGFAVKSIIDNIGYSHSGNGAPFVLHLAVNAVIFIIPASLAASIGLYINGRTRLLSVFAAILAGAAVLTVIISMILKNALIDSIIYAVPLLISALICGVFTAVSRYRKNKA